MAAACGNRDLRARDPDAIAATPSPNALSNALSAPEFHSIEAHFDIFCSERNAGCPVLPFGRIGLDVIQTPKAGYRITRYVLAEWATMRFIGRRRVRAMPAVERDALLASTGAG
jgi:hypothetical protein